MSFSSDLKAEIISAVYKKNCCRLSLLRGAALAKGRIENEHILLRVGDLASARFLSELVRECFSKEASIQAPPRGGAARDVVFSAPSLIKYINDIEGGTPYTDYLKCPACRYSFFRGIFLASGRVSNPEKQFSLEFSLGDRLDVIKGVFFDAGLELKLSVKPKETVLYTKNSYLIEDFFSLCELNSATFSIINTKISNDFKNNANRHRNFDTVNITKAVAAAEAQLAAIRMLDERGLLSNLSEELESTARLRLTYPDLSLYQLSLLSVPTVSKSGIAHRLRKIAEYAEGLDKKK